MSRADSWKRLQQLKRIRRYTLPKLEKSKNRPWRGAAFAFIILLSLIWGCVYSQYLKEFWGQYFMGLGR